MSCDDQSIAVNKGVHNTMDIDVCTILVVGIEASVLKLRTLTDWTHWIGQCRPIQKTTVIVFHQTNPRGHFFELASSPQTLL